MKSASCGRPAEAIGRLRSSKWRLQPGLQVKRPKNGKSREDHPTTRLEPRPKSTLKRKSQSGNRWNATAVEERGVWVESRFRRSLGRIGRRGISQSVRNGNRFVAQDARRRSTGATSRHLPSLILTSSRFNIS